MNFSKFDMVILIVMSVSIVVMSFVFPALGLAGADTSESEIPEFDMQSDRFDFSSDFPSREAATPANGMLDFDTSEDSRFSDNQVWLHGSTDPAGAEINLVRNGSRSDAKVNLLGWDEGSVVAQDNITLENEGDKGFVEITAYVNGSELGGYTILVEMVSKEELADDNYRWEVKYEIQETPPVDVTEKSWIDRIPIVGGLYRSADGLTDAVMWFTSVIWWFVTTTWEVALNVLGMTVDVAVYLFGTISWLLGTYGAIMSAAEAWVALFVALPGILLFLEFAKLGMILVSLLPFT